MRAAKAAGSPHEVYLSVVGADKIPVSSRVDRGLFGCYASMFAAEQTIADSRLPWTTLLTTQFHDLMLLTAKQMSELPVIPGGPGPEARGPRTRHEGRRPRLSERPWQASAEDADAPPRDGGADLRRRCEPRTGPCDRPAHLGGILAEHTA